MISWLVIVVCALLAVVLSVSLTVVFFAGRR
jgi:hypothetical protein